jgi:TldD protein
MHRRRFLQGSAAGAATLTLPGFLGACHKQLPPGSFAGALPADPFTAWFGVDAQAVREVLAELGARGADLADVFLQHRRDTSIRLEDGLIGQASTSVVQGAGLRVVVGDQTGYAFTEDLSLGALKEAARTAATIAHGAARPGPGELRWPEIAHADLYALQVPWSDVGIDQRLPVLTRLEALARAADPAVQKVTISWSDQEERVLVATLDGLVFADQRPQTRLWCSVVAQKDGATQANSANLAGRQGIAWYTDERLAQLARDAVDRTLVLFDARRPPAGELPVVLAAGASGILLHEAVGHGLEADFNRKGTSIYADKLGQSVAADFVTVVDTGLEAHERGALRFDDEGNPAQRTVLIDRGRLASYMHDAISARHYGVTPTGSGRRESFRHVPLPRMRCTTMENGPHTREEIIASVDRGIIAETFTNGQVQIGAGDFTFYIKNGWLIEGGKITAPIKDVNIIGNGPEALQRVTMAADDARLDSGGWTCGKDGQGVPVSQGLPTVLVSRLTVGGVDA